MTPHSTSSWPANALDLITIKKKKNQVLFKAMVSSHLILIIIPQGSFCYSACFTSEKTEAKRGEVPDVTQS